MTKEEIEDQIAALLEQYMSLDAESPHILTGWLIQARGVGPESRITRAIWLAPDGQDIFTSLGLASALEMNVSGQYTDAWSGEPEDE